MRTIERLVLFDVDKTLVSGSSGHAEAFIFGFREVYGVETTAEEVVSESRATDMQTICEMLKKRGLSEDRIRNNLGRCIDEMEKYFGQIKSGMEIEVMPGVCELLQRLDNGRNLLGLVTGNLEPIGRGKLEVVGLNDYFKIGGFGSDGDDKEYLTRLAVQRAGENFGFRFDNNCFLFGDAQNDIVCTKRAGVRAVGVATGVYSCEELRKAGADYVFEDLRDIERVVGILEG